MNYSWRTYKNGTWWPDPVQVTDAPGKVATPESDYLMHTLSGNWYFIKREPFINFDGLKVQNPVINLQSLSESRIPIDTVQTDITQKRSITIGRPVIVPMNPELISHTASVVKVMEQMPWAVGLQEGDAAPRSPFRILGEVVGLLIDSAKPREINTAAKFAIKQLNGHGY